MLLPIAKRVIIKPVEENHNSKIITINQKPSRFTVIAIGDEVSKVKIGDIIFLEKHYGVEIDYEHDKVQVIDESSILAKIAIA